MAIKVVATAIGFYQCLRVPGDEFSVSSSDDVGKWMRRLEAEQGEDKPKELAKDESASQTADQLKELIASSEDLEFLMECEKDKRVTIRRAAAERLEVLREG